MKEISLVGGFITQVDDEDYDSLNQYKWCTSKGGKTLYAVRNAGNQKIVSMHRVILGNIEEDVEVDHADRNGLNNQRYNLRLATKSQQQANTEPYSGCSSKYKGIVWFKPKQKWRSRISYKGKEIHLGYFTSEQEAATHYDVAALGLFGVFAYLNFPKYKDEYIEQLDHMGFTEKENGIWRK